MGGVVRGYLGVKGFWELLLKFVHLLLTIWAPDVDFLGVTTKIVKISKRQEEDKMYN